MEVTSKRIRLVIQYELWWISYAYSVLNTRRMDMKLYSFIRLYYGLINSVTCTYNDLCLFMFIFHI